jgi:hypothetical protein
MLSEKSSEVLEQFFLQREQFEQTVASMNPQELAQVLSEVLALYANDKNSSTLREWVVLRIAGCQHRPDKIGYNGYRGEVPYEVKPRNVRSAEQKRKRLNGDGNFTDFTYERLEKYLQDKVRVLVAGFVDGNLIYVLEVPFESLRNTLKAQLDRQFHGKRPKGVFLRSANFSFRDYANDADVRCLFLNPQWRNFADFLSRDFCIYLERFEGR